MLSTHIIRAIETLRNGGQSAPFLTTEVVVDEVLREVFAYDRGVDIAFTDVILSDLFIHDCDDREGGGHQVKQIRTFVEKLYQTPVGDMMVAVFLHIDALTDASSNALLRIFEDTPLRLLVLMTSASPEKILPTIRSRSIVDTVLQYTSGINPLQSSIDDYIAGHHEALFGLTLGKDFKRDQALWIVRGLQDTIISGKISPQYAQLIRQALMDLEMVHTSPKHIVDRLLIALSGKYITSF